MEKNMTSTAHRAEREAHDAEVGVVGDEMGHRTETMFWHDAAYIAAASPDVVLGLLDRLQAAEAAVERVRDLAGSLYWLGGGKGPDLARALRSALDGPQDAATGEVALGSTDEPIGPPRDRYDDTPGGHADRHTLVVEAAER